MSPQTRLKVTSVGFAVLWTALMWWWNRPEIAGTVILAGCGAVTGLLWYFAMKWWFKHSGIYPTS